MSILKSYLKIVVRNVWKYKLQNLFSILGISVGFVFFIISLYWLKYETSYDAHIKNSSRIYQVIYKSIGENQFARSRFQYKSLQDIYQNIPEVQMFCFAKPNTYMFVNQENATNEIMTNLLEVDKNFFTLLDVRFVEGEEPSTFDSFSYKVIVTETLAKKIFGRTDVLNEKIRNSNNGLYYHIIGVVKDNPVNSTIHYDALVPMNKNMESADFCSYVLLDKKTHRENAVTKLNQEIQKREIGPLDLIPLQQVKYRITGVSFWKAYSPLIAIVISSFLLLFCTFLNLHIVTLSKFMQRIRECVFHRQLGATSKYIYLLHYLEIGLLLLLSFLFGVIFIELIIKPFYEIAHIRLDTNRFLYFSLWGMVVFLFVVSITFAASIQYISKSSKFKSATNKPFVKNLNLKILFFQIIISGVFIFILSVVFFQFSYMIKMPTGLPTNNIVFLDLRFDQTLKKNSEALINDLKAGSMIMDATVQSLVIFDNNEQTISSNELENLAGINKNVPLVRAIVTQESAEFFHFQLDSGRFAEHIQSPVEVMMNEEAVKQLGLIDPIGKTFQLYEDPYVIVGVVKDYISKPLSSPLVPIMYILYTPLRGYMHYTAYVKYDPAKRTTALNFIDQVCRRYSPEYDKEKVLKPMDSYIRSFYDKEVVVIKILSFITVACLLITLWGILSVVSFTLRQQRKSIAVRKIMGASHSLLLKMYLKQYALLAAIACTIGILIAYPFVKRWLEVYAFRIHLGIPIFLIVYGIILIVVLLIAWILVTRALNDNPADVVKENN